MLPLNIICFVSLTVFGTFLVFLPIFYTLFAPNHFKLQILYLIQVYICLSNNMRSYLGNWMHQKIQKNSLNLAKKRHFWHFLSYYVRNTHYMTSSIPANSYATQIDPEQCQFSTGQVICGQLYGPKWSKNGQKLVKME